MLISEMTEMKKLDKHSLSSSPVARTAQSADASTMRRITSNELLAGRKELAIEHSGEEYRLRITSKGKLILTK